MSDQAGSWYRETGDGLQIFVRLTPRSASDTIDGPDEILDMRRCLKVRVRAVPENGKANRALEKLLSKWLGVPKSEVLVTGGTTSRLKTVSVAGNHEALFGMIALAEGAWTNGASQS